MPYRVGMVKRITPSIAALLIAASAHGRQSMGTVSGDDEPAKTPASKDFRPPAPTDPGKPNVIVPYLLTFVLGGVTVGLAVLPSGRTHQD